MPTLVRLERVADKTRSQRWRSLKVEKPCRKACGMASLKAKPLVHEVSPIGEEKALRCAIRCGEWRGNPLGAASK
ncbi:hypothetical protein FNW02_15460 [Komarekiella sp. 'clone 1']|uniref:Uncharacterized protein n=1 Tax=Komarekiella delphini-convector SJRDD-AB1 TaxID=2593771 RepID=A0AA40VRS1_9NOST|nr:hypothetical protein [Komarekiella delphini-convector]MBD6617192.1 hypothetical protein [Komarekiella delphini-convector SJRDD-AB1]